MTKHNGLFKESAKSARVLTILGRAAALALILVSALMTGGCLVGNKEYDEVRQKRDEYSSNLQRMHESNDILKREISETYESCDLISSQLVVLAAMTLHDRYTANLGRPILPPPIQATTPTPATTSTRSTRTQRAVRGEQSGQQGTAGRTGTSSGSRQTSGSGRSGSSGGTRTTPPPTPPANTGGGGSIDWGL